jgi:anthranilate synthase component 1
MPEGQASHATRHAPEKIPPSALEPTREEFVSFVARERSSNGQAPARTLVVPLVARLLADQLTPVLAYRRLVAPDERTAPSFLFESVEGGERQGRYSILSSRPVLEVVAYADHVRITPHGSATPLGAGAPDPTKLALDPRVRANPLAAPKLLSAHLAWAACPTAAGVAPLPACLLGGWVGFAGYDTVRYVEPEKLPFAASPRDDRGLPDLHFAFYDGAIVFDHADKLVLVVQMAMVAPGDEAGAAYDRAAAALSRRAEEIQQHSRPLPAGVFSRGGPVKPAASNLTREQHASIVSKALEYIRAGDIFQVVLGQRFEKWSSVDPFDVYRALRAVNPSPYMVYLQGEGTILVASSPEILCRVRKAATPGAAAKSIVTNRPLAGTRKRGTTPEEDIALEKELLADQKERAEHIMLVDLGRNDLGRVCVPGSIALPAVMEIERYSHVMHISSTVTGELRDGLDCWDALAATLPVGTISGAPKIRAMQIIDELEPIRRGPYGGGMGYIGLDGQMDIALALRTIVVPVEKRRGGDWLYHLQASGGIVADSVADSEYHETVNKAAAMLRAIDVAERAFAGKS